MFKKVLRSLLAALFRNEIDDFKEQNARLLLVQGKLAAGISAERHYLNNLAEAEFQVFSQWGDDGILEWIISRLPVSNTQFIEFGVESYQEANTRFLLVNRNWRGLIIDSDPDLPALLRSQALYWRHDLTAISAFISCGNINSTILDAGLAGPIGLLSIDIDGNDYWVWESIHSVRPDIVVCEYNAVFGDIYPISIPYEASFNRTRAHPSNLYFGASIGALQLLAHRKGYKFAGTNQAGVNAFFVREELFDIISPMILSKRAYPSMMRESRDLSGALTYISGPDRLREICHLDVVRVDSGETIRIDQLGEIYSADWLNMMGEPATKHSHNVPAPTLSELPSARGGQTSKSDGYDSHASSLNRATHADNL